MLRNLSLWISKIFSTIHLSFMYISWIKQKWPNGILLAQLDNCIYRKETQLVHLEVLSSQLLKNFHMYKQGFEEAEEPDIKLSAFIGSWRKQGNSRKTSASASLTMLKPLTVWITTSCGKFFKRWEYQTTWLASWESACRSGDNS